MKKLLVVLCLTMGPLLAHGATYYVAKTGSDSNSCGSAQSQSTPKLTMNVGLGCLSAGDTLIVKAGTYDEQITSGTIPSGSPGAPTTIRSEVPGGAVLGNTIEIGNNASQSNILLDGLVIDGGQAIVGYGIAFQSQASNVTIQNMEIKNILGINNCSNSGGIFFGSNGGGFVVRGTKIHDIGNNQLPEPTTCNCCFSYGIYLPTHDVLFENNELYNLSGFAIHGYSSGGAVDNNIIRNNYIHETGPVLIACGGSGNQVHNNTIANVGHGPASFNGGIDAGGYCSGTTVENNMIYNNTLYKNGGNCMGLGGGSSPFNKGTIRNNICWQNDNDAIVVNSGADNAIDHNFLGTDPLFVNPAGGDFHLQSGSLAIDAGVVIPGLPFNGSAPDLGAFETGAGRQLPAPTNLRFLGN